MCGDVLYFWCFHILKVHLGVQINLIIHSATLDFLPGCQNKIVATYQGIVYSFLFCILF